MLEATVESTAANGGDLERKLKWDSFLDAYSTYLRNPNAVNAVSLHLAGVAVAGIDTSFSVQTFERRLGWDLSLNRS